MVRAQPGPRSSAASDCFEHLVQALGGVRAADLAGDGDRPGDRIGAVLQREGDRITRPGGARYLAEHIPGATLAAPRVTPPASRAGDLVTEYTRQAMLLSRSGRSVWNHTGSVYVACSAVMVAGGQPQAWVQLVQPWNNLFLILVMVWLQTGYAMVLISAAIKPETRAGQFSSASRMAPAIS